MARNTHSFRPRGLRQKGSVTLVALCLTTALGIALGSYLALCSRSAQFSARVVSQDQAQQLAQSGLEEALWALNQNTWTSSGHEGNAVWTTSGANRTVTLSYALPAPNTSGEIALTIANYASTGPAWPTITSAATVTLQSGQRFTKSLQAVTAPVPLFGNAIASADSYVSFAAGGTVDSWNSDPDNNSSTPAVAYSFTAGNATNYAAVVAGRGNGTHGVILTQATVRGYVATFGLPVSYSTSGSPAANVVGPATPTGVTVDSSRLGQSAFVPVAPAFSVTLPSVSGGSSSLLGTVLDLLNALLSLPAGGGTVKYSGDLTLNGASILGLLSSTLTIDKPTKILVDGDLALTTGLLGTKGKITITPTGSLELYVTGDVTIGGDGFDNQTNEPKKLAIYCTSTATSDTLEYTTTRSFCGVIFCEKKPIDIRQNATFYGALLSSQYVRFSNSATSPVFHYDTALRQVRFGGVTTPYLLTRQTEL